MVCTGVLSRVVRAKVHQGLNGRLGLTGSVEVLAKQT